MNPGNLQTVSFCAVALALCGTLANAQELTPEQVQKLLERRQVVTKFVPGEIIVKMKTTVGISSSDLTRLKLESTERRTSGGEILYRIPTPVTATLSTSQARERTLALVRELSERSDVEYAQPNYILHIADTTPNDTRYPEQWHYRNNGSGSGESPGGIRLPKAWDAGTGAQGIVVAVIDTGILPNHPDISGSPNLIAGYDMISDPTRANDGSGRDNVPTDPGDAVAANECGPGEPAQPNSWHGTHVAGTIGVGRTNNNLGVAGVNWQVSVQPVRVLGKCGATLVDINDAIRWSVGLPVPGVPNNTTPARVINMSLGSPPGIPCSMSPATQAAINDAVGQNALVVVAAGNDAVDASQVFPASCNNVVTVAASDFRGHLVTRYSNFGSTVEIMAPGGDVLRDDDGDGNNDGVLSMVQGGYARYNGTSMAAPHVAGVAALWLSRDSTLTPAQLLTRLQSSAISRDSTQCPQPCGAGLLSALSDQLNLSLVLSPANVTLDLGDTATLIATVTMGGVPQAGKTVTFSSADTGKASVSPASGVTDASGQVQTTVRGETRWQGTTTLTATTNGKSASVPVQVPDLSLFGIVILIACLGLFGLVRKRVSARRG